MKELVMIGGRTMKSLKAAVLVSGAALGLAVAALAQAAPEPLPFQTGGLMVARGKDMGLHLESNMDVAPVKGAPFCANITTEHTQSFADGNRIHTTEKSMVCRDSEGRTRREASLNLLGASSPASAPELITIFDPVAGVRYLLDSQDKIAHKMALPPAGSISAQAPEPRGERVLIMQSADGPEGQVNRNMVYKKIVQDTNEPAPKTENLGDQAIDGIHATGTRVTTTIPSGKMGNDRPIVVTSERWYSPDLKATIMTKHSDPWAGELKTEFTNVNTSEPDPSLFTVPSDYKIVDDKKGPVTIRFQSPAPLPQ
jgi:hypothetical protein